MEQQALTVIVPIKPGEVKALKLILKESSREIDGSANTYFSELALVYLNLFFPR